VYLYEISESQESSISHTILKSIAKKGIILARAEKIYDEDCKNGLIWSKGIRDPNYPDEDTLEGHLQKYTNHTFCTEVPTLGPIKERIKSQRLIIIKILEEYTKKFIPCIR